MQLTSSNFAAGRRIAVEFTGDGADRSPSLSWNGLPAGTQQLALVVDDPDAPTPKPWVHWVVYSLPPNSQGLPAAVPPHSRISQPVGMQQGKNSWNQIGYRGPAPPRGHGLHHYYFTLYALNTALELSAGLSKPELIESISPHVIATSELVGTYSR